MVVFIGEVDGRRVEEAHEGAAHEEDEHELHVQHLAAPAFGQQRAERPVLGILGAVASDAILPAQTATASNSTQQNSYYIIFTVSNFTFSVKKTERTQTERTQALFRSIKIPSFFTLFLSHQFLTHV